MPRTFVMGDSHGAYRAFLQVMERSKFDYERDKLICLGDVSDGWPEVPELIEEILKIKNLVWIRGNHDQWLKDFLKYGKQPDVWVLQGGASTREAYLERHPELMQKHREVLQKTVFYYIDEKNRCFVHGGVKPGKHPKNTDKMYLMWDRQLWDLRHDHVQAEKLMNQFYEIYVGHTTIYSVSHRPLCSGNVWFIDTGGGWEGVLSMMEVDTKEIYQSDVVKDLYPETRGRN